ncbi:MAG: amidohydrolase family protein [Clostridiales bacterium]|nr:amidohydrolase family protein [Clostridiales bacterium]
MNDLLIKNGLIFTFIHEGYHALKLREADLLIEDGCIAKIASGITASCDALDAEGSLVLPGFIDMGSWSVAARLMAGLLPDRRTPRAQGTLLYTQVLPMMNLAWKLLSPEDAKALALHGLWTGLSTGTTTAVGLCSIIDLEAHLEAADELGMHIIPMRMGNIGGERVIRADAPAAQVKRVMKTKGTRCAFVTSSGHDTEELRRLSDLGYLSAEALIFQPVLADRFGRELIAASGASAVFSAVGCVQEGRAFPGVDFLRGGINTALATGCWGGAMLSEMRMAAFSAKQAEGDPSQYKATDAFYAATVAGGRALGLHDRLGRLEIGMSGDLSVVDMQRLEPLSYPFIQYLYGSTATDVRHVVQGGHVCKRDFAPPARVARRLEQTRKAVSEAILRVWDEAQRSIL